MSWSLSNGAAPPLGAFVAHMSAADFFGLVVSVLIIGYLFYALIRGEKL
jgi:K+-transporting ATPase KdpF subunit